MQLQSWSMPSTCTVNSIHAPFPIECAILNVNTSSAKLESMLINMPLCVARKVQMGVASGVSPIHHFCNSPFTKSIT